MRISLNEIKKYVQIPEEITNQKLIELIGSRLVEIEEVIDLAPKYQGIYIVKVVKAEPIAGTHLNLCEVDAGEHNGEFKQLENGLVQVVCGAPNVHAGMLAVWIAPGAIVPETYGNENFRISTRKLQGYESNGMLAGADELGFDDEHKAIAEIDPKMAKPGDSFAEVFDLNDIILDVENKSLTHRPDCFGLIGFAREIAGILGIKFQEPTFVTDDNYNKLKGTIKVDKALCPRYSCAVFDLPKNEPSKYLTPEAVFLAKAGMRAIDPMVDLTNIMMLKTGQPLHAFDYDKLLAVGDSKEVNIIVRAAEAGEQIQLLDGKTIECIPDDILITSNNVPVALAGAMGGKNTEIDASTTKVVLESATFSLYHLRKTQMAHGIFSEAITRFTKGQPAAMTLPVLLDTVAQLGVKTYSVADEYPEKQVPNTIKLTTGQINGLLGTEYPVETIAQTLENVGFEVRISDNLPSKAIKTPSEAAHAKSGVVAESEVKIAQKANSDPLVENRLLEVTAPVWRTDIHIPEDVIEEVGRLLGYDNITLELAQKAFSGTEISPMFQLKRKIRGILSDQLAMNELLTYSFTSLSLLEKVGQNTEDSYKIVNSISPELQCFRQQIVPSLLDKVRENVKAGHKKFTIYEMNQVTSRTLGLDQDGVPVLQTDLGMVCLGDFYELKADIFTLLERGLKIDIEYVQITPGSEVAKRYPYLEPARSAEIFVNNRHVGAFGEVKAAVLRRFKLETQVSACELNLEEIVNQKPTLQVEIELSKFPTVERDLTAKVAADMPFGRIDEVIRATLQQEALIFTVKPASIYQSEAESKNLSFRLRFASLDHTLNSAEITEIMNKITVEITKIGAKII